MVSCCCCSLGFWGNNAACRGQVLYGERSAWHVQEVRGRCCKAGRCRKQLSARGLPGVGSPKLGGDAKVLVGPWERATLNDQALLKVFKPPGAWVG